MKMIARSRICLFLLLFCLFKVSYASNHCDPKQIFNYQSISCCLSPQLSAPQCTALIDQLDRQLIQSIKTVQRDYRSGAYSRGVPNCFWMALGYHLPAFLHRPRTVYERDYVPTLRQYFTPLALEKISAGDIVTFSQTHVLDPDPTGPANFIYADVPFHAAIYLGEGLVLQKENYTDEVFSINTLENSFEAYASAAREQLGLETHLTAHRLK